MTRWQKIFRWVGLVLSVPAGGYLAGCFLYYSWLSAAEPDRWSPKLVGLWSGIAALSALLFFVIFIYCVVSLIRDANTKYRKEQNAA